METPTTKTHYKKLYNPIYIGSWDLLDGEDAAGNPKYKEITVTIESLTVETIELQNKKQEVKLLRFVGSPKPFILKPTNARLIKKALGTPIWESWIGKKITLHVINDVFFGEREDAVRVKFK